MSHMPLLQRAVPGVQSHAEQAAMTALLFVIYVLWLIAVSSAGQLDPLLCAQHAATSHEGFYECSQSTHCVSPSIVS